MLGALGSTGHWEGYWGALGALRVRESTMEVQGGVGSHWNPGGFLDGKGVSWMLWELQGESVVPAFRLQEHEGAPG